MKQLELYDTFPIKINVNKNKRSLIISDSDGVKKDYGLICEIEATHSGTLINNRIYPPKSMNKGVRSWTKPYKKPVLVNHNDTADPIGRIIKAKYVKTLRGLETDSYEPVLKVSDGYGYMRLTARVTDVDAIQKIIDGRYETVSVRMSTDHAFCSICDTDWSADGPCDHSPGQMYDKKLAYITTGDLFYREMSFVNIPADELAGVKEALLTEDKKERDKVNIGLYANNVEEGVLTDLASSEDINLYSFLDDKIEDGDEVVLHLLDRSSKTKKSNKEEDVKIEEITKDKLCELDAVKELVKDAVTKAGEEDAKKAKSDCETALTKLKGELKKDCVTQVDHEKVKKELEDVKKELEGCNKNSDSGKNGGCKEKADALEAELKEKEEDRKRIMDENIKINSELHKVVAERLYDLKKILKKPDVIDIKTPDIRNKKVEELAQRSIDSLKDQISDLLLEYEKAISIGYFGGDISNPGASQTDKTNEVDDSKAPKKETKKDALKRLFSKS